MSTDTLSRETASSVSPTSMDAPTLTSSDATVGERLQNETTAVRLKIHWPGVRKTLSQDQTRQAAGTFDADIKSVSASKKLLDTGHPAFRAVSAVRTQAADYWKQLTLPYVEPGMRLIRRRDITAFDDRMSTVRDELAAAVEQLERHYDEMIDQARERLGDLFDAGDYATNLRDQFGIEWDYPSVAPPEYLLRVSPQLYYSECERVQQRFDEAVRLAEQAFADELGQLVSHLAERLSGEADGSPKVFRDSAVTNLLDFFDRFQRLNIRSDEGLDRLVERARGIVTNVSPQDLRDRVPMRLRVADQLAAVESSLDDWMTDRPRRSILRRSR